MANYTNKTKKEKKKKIRKPKSLDDVALPHPLFAPLIECVCNLSFRA